MWPPTCIRDADVGGRLFKIVACSISCQHLLAFGLSSSHHAKPQDGEPNSATSPRPLTLGRDSPRGLFSCLSLTRQSRCTHEHCHDDAGESAQPMRFRGSPIALPLFIGMLGAIPYQACSKSVWLYRCMQRGAAALPP